MIKDIEIKEISTHFIKALMSQAALVFDVLRQYRDIFKLPKNQQQQWLNACTEEMKSMKEREVWDLTDLPPNRKPITGRWVFVKKGDSCIKARFIAKGFTQVFGIDFEETFSPVARFETVRLLLALAALEDWEIEGLDVKTAFLFRDLDEEIYLTQPEGFIIKG